jgi:hypothetical protein
MFCGNVKEFLSQNKIEFTDRNIAGLASPLCSDRNSFIDPRSMVTKAGNPGSNRWTDVWRKPSRWYHATAISASSTRSIGITFSSIMVSIPLTLDEPQFESFEDRPRAIPYPQLGKDAGDVVLHRPLRHPNSICDLAIAIASNHESQDFRFALRK